MNYPKLSPVSPQHEACTNSTEKPSAKDLRGQSAVFYSKDGIVLGGGMIQLD